MDLLTQIGTETFRYISRFFKIFKCHQFIFNAGCTRSNIIRFVIIPPETPGVTSIIQFHLRALRNNHLREEHRSICPPSHFIFWLFTIRISLSIRRHIEPRPCCPLPVVIIIPSANGIWPRSLLCVIPNQIFRHHNHRHGNLSFTSETGRTGRCTLFSLFIKDGKHIIISLFRLEFLQLARFSRKNIPIIIEMNYHLVFKRRTRRIRFGVQIIQIADREVKLMITIIIN